MRFHGRVPQRDRVRQDPRGRGFENPGALLRRADGQVRQEGLGASEGLLSAHRSDHPVRDHRRAHERQGNALACGLAALARGRSHQVAQRAGIDIDRELRPSMELLSDPQSWIAFFTLTALELVLGIDNIIFISVLVDKLPEAQRELARRIGLALAMFMRIGLLFLLAWISAMIEPLFTVFRQEISGRDLILIAGGLFLLWKSTQEIHQLLEGEKGEASAAVRATLSGVILQVMIIDIVFSLDSIVTAVGMVDRVEVMIAAVIASVLLMMAFAGGIGRFVSAHPTGKMLALAFLFVIADGFDHHVPKGYVYFAMAFSVCVEMLNLRMRKRAVRPVELHDRYSR